MSFDTITFGEGVVMGHRNCQTEDAKWLAIPDIYAKLHRFNSYDIGGTNERGSRGFWFFCQTEQVHSLHLIHIFINNDHETQFIVSISDSNVIQVDEKLNISFLSSNMKQHQFDIGREVSQNYIVTYCFTEACVETLRDTTLYIPITLNKLKCDYNTQIVETLNFDALLKDPVGVDFTIETADAFQIKVHKDLLCAFSEVFKAMLKEDTAESQKNFVKLEDVSKEDLMCLIEFIYTGFIKDFNKYNFLNVLMIADKYDIKDLRDLSEQATIIHLSEDNVLETLVVADLCCLSSLKKAAFQFIKANPETIQQDVFKKLNAELNQELCTFLATTIGRLS